MNFIVNPTENAYLQGRQDNYLKRRGLTRVKEMRESGINVCFGQDSINDPWYPVGNGAKTLSVEDPYGIEEGKPANFWVLSADSPFEAVRQRAEVLASIRHGEHLFKRPEPTYEIALDLFRRTN